MNPGAGAILLAATCGALLGSVPWGWLLMRASGGPDPRTVGSGNIGATNVVRAGGKGLGALTLALDAGKGAAAALAFGPGIAGAVAGGAAVMGHCFTPWLRFRGGKGVATFLGASAVSGWPWALPVFVATWLVIFFISRIPAVAGISAPKAVAVVSIARAAAHPAAEGVALAAILGACALVVLLRHQSNFERMRAGEATP